MGCERLSDLESICADCHKIEHAKEAIAKESREIVESKRWLTTRKDTP